MVTYSALVALKGNGYSCGTDRNIPDILFVYLYFGTLLFLDPFPCWTIQHTNIVHLEISSLLIQIHVMFILKCLLLNIKNIIHIKMSSVEHNITLMKLFIVICNNMSFNVLIVKYMIIIFTLYCK